MKYVANRYTLSQKPAKTLSPIFPISTVTALHCRLKTDSSDAIDVWRQTLNLIESAAALAARDSQGLTSACAQTWPNDSLASFGKCGPGDIHRISS